MSRAAPGAAVARERVDKLRAACDHVGVPPATAMRALLVLLAACLLPPVGYAVQARMAGDASAPRQLGLAQAQISKLVHEKADLVHSYEGQLAKMAQRLQMIEAQDELLRSTTKATQGEKAALAKTLRFSEARVSSLETSLASIKERASREKDARDKEAKEKERKGGKGASTLFGQLNNLSKSGVQGVASILSKNANATETATEAALSKVRQATGAAKEIAQEVGHAAGYLLEAVKHGFESQPNVG
jgi:hypothetical protein